MQKGLTEMVFILDRSGSMSGLEAETISGFNSLIEKQKREEGRAIVSTVLFDDEIKILHDQIDVNKVRPITHEDYYVGGCTSLLDAIGKTIWHISGIHKHSGPKDMPEKTMVIITTDGMENASLEYTFQKINKMITKKREKYHWEFVFLGANTDAVKSAAGMGIKKDHAANYTYDGDGIKCCFRAASNILSAVRQAEDEYVSVLDFLKMISEDYKAREGEIKKRKIKRRKLS